MTPNPIQALTYFAGRTERVGLGTFVAVAPWWNPVRLAHQIAYLDIVSKGRYNTIGIGRGVSKREFDAVGVPREESRERFNEMPRHPGAGVQREAVLLRRRDLHVPRDVAAPGAAQQGPVLPDLQLVVDRRVAGDPVAARHGAAVRRQQADRGRRRGSAEGQHLPPGRGLRALPAEERDVHVLHCPTSRTAQRRPTSGSGPPTATSPCTTASPTRRTSRASRAMRPTPPARPAPPPCWPRPCRTSRSPAPRRLPGYHASNLLIGTPGRRSSTKLKAAQEACSFSEVTIVPQFGTMPYADAIESVKLFAREVLPAVHEMAAPLHRAALPAEAPWR